MSDSNQRRSEILGMPFGTACNRLRRIVMFDLLQRHEENVCFKCGKVIFKAEDLSLEHKETWQDGGPSLFWDLTNIAFSHRQCNLPKGIVRREIVDGMLWCSNCKLYKPISCFHRERKQRTGYAFLCKDCSNSKRREVRATGDCNSCGAVRGTTPFRSSHNLCMRCHRELDKARYTNQQLLNRSAK
jgi:hypothetical protein